MRDAAAFCTSKARACTAAEYLELQQAHPRDGAAQPTTCAPNANPTAPFAKATARAVLVAIAIPVFTGQLEKAREATDEANLRSAYAEVMAAVLTETKKSTNTDPTEGVVVTVSDGVVTAERSVALQQAQDGWQGGAPTIGDQELTDNHAKAGKSVTVTMTSSADHATFAEAQ